jgi:hypothetical protein
MKRILGTFLFLLLTCAAVASAQSTATTQPAVPAQPAVSASLTPADRQKAVDYLAKTKQGVLDATSGLSEAQWNFKAGPDRWSIAEVTEHIAAAEDFLRGNVEDNVLKAPARTENADVAAIDAMVLQAIPDRSTKFQAPEPLKPTNRFGSPEAALKHFAESRAKTETLLKENPELRAHATDSPIGKQLDAYEWILFVAAHSDRHTKQILEVKADPKFPKT